MGGWLDVKPEVFNALVDAAIYAQLHRGAQSLGRGVTCWFTMS